jgi:hypothetical protein
VRGVRAVWRHIAHGLRQFGAYLVTLTGGAGHYQVQGVDRAEDGSGFGASVKWMFSPAGHVEFERRQKGSRQDEPDLRIEAKATLGLPPDAPVATR